MSKHYVHGQVRLATASPRVGEYDYVDRNYTPADYYGDHFLFRSDRNLLPTAPGLYTASSPYTFQSTTGFPPFFDKHSSAYAGLHAGFKPNGTPSYLGDSDMTEQEMMDYLEDAGATYDPNDAQNEEDMLDDIDETVNDPNLLEQFGSALLGWWNSLDKKEKKEATDIGLALAEEGYAYATGEQVPDDTGSGIINNTRIQAMNNSVLLASLQLAKNKLPPFVFPLYSDQERLRVIRLMQWELVRRGLLTLKRTTELYVPIDLSAQKPESILQNLQNQGLLPGGTWKPKKEKKGGAVTALILTAGTILLGTLIYKT